VGSEDALAFWDKRLGENGIRTETESGPDGDHLRFWDPEGLGHALKVVETDDAPLEAEHPDVPEGMGLQGFDGAIAYSADPGRSRPLLEALEFEPSGGGWEARGEERGGLWAYEEPPSEPGREAAGTVHHIAWASKMDEHEAWRERAIEAGARATPVIDRFYFKSIYFREPSGVLFEIATLGPGFTVDEPLESLGEKLSLPPDYEHLRERVEPELTPLVNPNSRQSS
jgi:glyoxalase family protein